jgi:hypothetical protein
MHQLQINNTIKIRIQYLTPSVKMAEFFND